MTRPFRFLHPLLDAAFPQTCLVCECWIPGRDGSFCSECDAMLAGIRETPYCRRCGRTSPEISQHSEGCRGCAAERWNVAAIARVGPYADALKTLVLATKYGGSERAARVLSTWLADVIREKGWARDIEALVPVPMHWKRRLQRKCNHARWLATLTGEKLRMPVVAVAARERYAPSQTELSVRSQRFENVKGCFRPVARRSFFFPAADVRGKAVCIIDNFLSSGATLYEVAKVVRAAGAKKIYAAIVARSSPTGRPQADWETVVAASNEAADEFDSETRVDQADRMNSRDS